MSVACWESRKKRRINGECLHCWCTASSRELDPQTLLTQVALVHVALCDQKLAAVAYRRSRDSGKLHMQALEIV